MAVSNKKYYLGYLNKLVQECNNTNHHSIDKKLLYKNIFSKGYTKYLSKEIFVIDWLLKTNQWTYKIKDLNGQEIIGRFCEKELLLSKL